RDRVASRRDEMRTLFLNPPSYDDFDGGAGSRYQAKREVWSFWYPTWLCYPAGMLPGARVLDAPPHDVSPEETVRIARDFDLLVVHTSTPSFRADVRTAQAIKDVKPEITIGFVGGHVTAMPEESLRYAPVIDFVARKEFDLAVVAVAEGRPFPEIKELFSDDDTFTADPPRAREIAQGLGRMGITWSTNSRANVDRETLKVLKDGGLRLFVVGYESGNEQILKNIRKGVSVE